MWVGSLCVYNFGQSRGCGRGQECGWSHVCGCRHTGVVDMGGDVIMVRWYGLKSLVSIRMSLA